MSTTQSHRKTLITPAISRNLFSLALQPSEKTQPFPWHRDADSPRSSQAFCLSAFGSLRHQEFGAVSDGIIADFVAEAFPWMRTAKRPRHWQIEVEVENPPLLNETGAGQPTSIDVLLSSSKDVVAIESKFLVDAEEGFGRCGQYYAKNGPRCRGFYGPGSDCCTGTSAWCRLENWDGHRAPRLYWSFSRPYFKPEMFRAQTSGDTCPLRDSNYQLVRNFLFAAARAITESKDNFVVLVTCPGIRTAKLEKQINSFCEMLLPDYRNRVKLVHYERLIELFSESRCDAAVRLAEFLSQRMKP